MVVEFQPKEILNLLLLDYCYFYANLAFNQEFFVQTAQKDRAVKRQSFFSKLFSKSSN